MCVRVCVCRRKTDLVVQVLEGARDLSNIKPGAVLRETPVLGKVEEDFTAVDVFHDLYSRNTAPSQ